MEKKFKIRFYRSDDLRKIISLTINAYSVPYKKYGVVNKYQETLKKIKEDIKKGLKILVAEENDVLVGVVRFAPIGKDRLKLGRLAVLPVCRCKGIGSKLINSVIKFAKKYKFKVVVLDVMQEKGLIPFYEKFGFEVKSKKKHENHHDVIMEKTILL